MDFFSSKVKNLAKQYTGIKDEGRAVVKFREVLKSRDMFFNRDSFPINESGDEAYMKCTDSEGARAFCPMRWKALQKWINYTKHVCKTLVNFYSHRYSRILEGHQRQSKRKKNCLFLLIFNRFILKEGPIFWEILITIKNISFDKE